MFVHGAERWWIISWRTCADSESSSIFLFSTLRFLHFCFSLFLSLSKFTLHQSLSSSVSFSTFFPSQTLLFRSLFHCITAFSGQLEWGSFSLHKWMGTLCSNGSDCSVGDNTTDSCQNWITLWLEHLVLFFSCVLTFYGYMPSHAYLTLMLHFY